METNCAFQYAYTEGLMFGNTVIVHDQSNLTLDEAKALFLKYKPEIMKKLQQDNLKSLEAVIWINMPNSYSFGDNLIYVTQDFETDGKEIWETVKQYVKV